MMKQLFVYCLKDEWNINLHIWQVMYIQTLLWQLCMISLTHHYINILIFQSIHGLICSHCLVRPILLTFFVKQMMCQVTTTMKMDLKRNKNIYQQILWCKTYYLLNKFTITLKCYNCGTRQRFQTIGSFPRHSLWIIKFSNIIFWSTS